MALGTDLTLTYSHPRALSSNPAHSTGSSCLGLEDRCNLPQPVTAEGHLPGALVERHRRPDGRRRTARFLGQRGSRADTDLLKAGSTKASSDLARRPGVVVRVAGPSTRADVTVGPAARKEADTPHTHVRFRKERVSVGRSKAQRSSVPGDPVRLAQNSVQALAVLDEPQREHPGEPPIREGKGLGVRADEVRLATSVLQPTSCDHEPPHRDVHADDGYARGRGCPEIGSSASEVQPRTVGPEAPAVVLIHRKPFARPLCRRQHMLGEPFRLLRRCLRRQPPIRPNVALEVQALRFVEDAERLPPVVVQSDPRIRLHSQVRNARNDGKEPRAGATAERGPLRRERAPAHRAREQVGEDQSGAPGSSPTTPAPTASRPVTCSTRAIATARPLSR